MASTQFARVARVVVGLVVVAGIAVVVPEAAHALPTTGHSSTKTATPTPTTISGVTQALTDLGRTNEQLTERFNAAQIRVVELQRAAAAASTAATAAQAGLVVAQQDLAASVSAQYRASSFSRTAALLGSTSGQNYIETVQSLNLLSEHQAAVAHIAASAEARSVKAKADAKHAVAAAVAQRASLAAQRSSLQGQITKYKALLSTLTAAQKKKFFSANLASAAQVATAVALPAPSKAAAAVIAAARAELGKPYVWGAGGPSSFDCSGLTAWAWRAAGVSLPHNAAAQYGYGTHVSQNDLKPGDLVFFYSPIGHVGIYIGDGLMIHAPTTGDVVKISPVFAMGDYVGATRL